MKVLHKIRKYYERVRQVPGTDHKPWLRILAEIAACIVFRRLEASLYFEGRVYLKGRQIGDYISTREFQKLTRAHNSPEYYPILEDKYVFDQILQGNGFHSSRNRFILSRGNIVEYGTGRSISPEDFLGNELDGFCKLINGFGGHSIYKLSVKDGKLNVNNENVTLAEFIRRLGKNEFLVQEKIQQHPLMNELNPSCLNTLRMITVQNGKEIVNLNGYLRVGINNNFVDNSLSGNVYVGFDQESGMLFGPAKLEGSKINTQTFDLHPQTQKPFNGFQIPYFHEACLMVKDLHRLFRQFYIIGWDIGITEDGPIVIEGNNITALYHSQVLYGGERPTLMHHLSEYKENQ